MSGETLRYSTSTPIPVEPDNPLTTLIRRLEAATSRLEDIAGSSPSADQQAGPQNVAAAGGMSQSPQEGSSKAGAPEGSTGTVVREQLPPAIEDMDALINTDVKAFVDASKGLDSVVEEQVSRDGRSDRGQRVLMWRGRQHWSQKHSPTNGDSWSPHPGRRSRIHSPKPSWTC